MPVRGIANTPSFVPGFWGGSLQGYLAHKKHPPAGPYGRNISRVIWWSWEGELFLMSVKCLFNPETRNRKVEGVRVEGFAMRVAD